MAWHVLAVAMSMTVALTLEGCGGETKPTPPRNFVPNTPTPANLKTVPTIAPVHSKCEGKKLGLYTWGHEVWNMEKSSMVDFLLNDKARDFACGDIYINVSDYSAPTWIPNENSLVPFIKNIRATGNRSTVYLVYGDVQVSHNGSPDGPRDFANLIFDWVARLTQAELDSIVPIGLSYDCEQMSKDTIINALTRAQERKAEILSSRLHNNPSNLIIQWTIEGQKKPGDTDAIMKLADSALMMLYRNHVAPSPRDPEGKDTIIDRLFDYMLKEQCKFCLDDAYATANYKAKITIMVEADCACGSSCGKISFCAMDASEPEWGGSHPNGAAYMMDTLAKAEEKIRARLPAHQFKRLFGEPELHSLFAVHNWQWFTCFFKDPTVGVTVPWGKLKNHTCKHYESYARSCRKL